MYVDPLPSVRTVHPFSIVHMTIYTGIGQRSLRVVAAAAAAMEAQPTPSGSSSCAAYPKWVMLEQYLEVIKVPGFLVLPDRRRRYKDTGGRPHQRRAPDPSLPPLRGAPGTFAYIPPDS